MNANSNYESQKQSSHVRQSAKTPTTITLLPLTSIISNYKCERFPSWCTVFEDRPWLLRKDLQFLFDKANKQENSKDLQGSLQV